jgi:multicomponent Na+:H+ antiporter subunit E
MNKPATPPGGESRGNRGKRGKRVLAPRTLAASAMVFAFWLVISASLAPADLALGAVLSLLLGAWSTRFLWAGETPAVSPREIFALAMFLMSFSREVFHSAVHVARVVLDPRLPIRPRLIVCRTGLAREVSRVAFANAVSLTPGTLTVDMDGSTFLVHCLDDETAEHLMSGALERRIAAVFEPGEQP